MSLVLLVGPTQYSALFIAEKLLMNPNMLVAIDTARGAYSNILFHVSFADIHHHLAERRLKFPLDLFV